MVEDTIVAEVRKARDEYAAQFNYDLREMYRDLQRQQRESGRQYVTYPPKRPTRAVVTTDSRDA
jgi:hypothetical protein